MSATISLVILPGCAEPESARMAFTSILFQNAAPEFKIILSSEHAGMLGDLLTNRIVVTEQKTDFASNIRSLIEAAKTEYVLFLDPRDILFLDAMQNLSAILASQPAADLFVGAYQPCDGKLEPNDTPIFSEPIAATDLPRKLLQKNALSIFGLCVKWKTLLAMPPFHATHGEEFLCEIIARCVSQHLPIIVHPFALAMVRQAEMQRQPSASQRIPMILQQCPIENTFPELAWDQNPKHAAAQALLTVTLMAIEQNAADIASDTLALAAAYDSTHPATRIISAMVKQAQGHLGAAAREFQNIAVDTYEKELTELYALSMGKRSLEARLR